jgi:dolichol kinase
MVFNLLDLLGFPGLDLVWDIIAFFISLMVILMLVQINAKVEQSGKLSTDVTRKVIHIFAAPLWVLTWMLFSGSVFSRYLAIIVPLFFVLQFAAIGTGKVENKDFVDSMSRSGDPKELLGGTLYYALLMVFFGIISFYTIDPLYTTTTPLAIIVFACLAGGDGLADVIGRKYGGEKKFGIMGSERTIAGSIGMFLGSFLFSFILMFFFSFEIAAWNPIPLLLPLLVISLIATIVEALSPKGLDNWTVPIVVAILLIFIVYLFPVWTFANQTLW